jgi:hypothetical protein
MREGIQRSIHLACPRDGGCCETSMTRFPAA